MRMKIILGGLVCAVAAATFVVPAEARINQRQFEQHKRIQNGVHSGALTRHEATGLRRQQATIARYERQSRRDGTGLSRYERGKIEHMQDRASRNIRREKRDRQRR